jgi:hypothetical protein
MLMFENVRFEIDTNKNLRITFTANQESARFARNMARQWKSTKAKFEWRLVLPGKILSSGLPQIEGNATWLNLDGEKADSADAALKLIGSPLVITAEPAGIKLEEPLDSKKLVMQAWRKRKSELDIPITEAGPGFTAEAASITLSTAHYFPEGQKYTRTRPEFSMFGIGSTGAVVSAKLFPPKDREIKSVSGLRVKTAKDDKGRLIPNLAGTEEESEENYVESFSYTSGEQEKGGPARIDLRLALPAPDARSIDELQAEAVALTIGSWKEMTLTNVQADAKKEIDLNEILPGAKLIIKKVGGRKPQRMIEATLEGPSAVSQVELKVKTTTRRGGNSSMSERRSSTSGNKTTRAITVHSYEFQMGPGENKPGPLVLIVRYPQDVKRERVQFKLTALDLL